ncbi:hypothetical protein DSL72_005935 [Monilinia vaccinii-corymbosi]|uniref:Uncharacterized protein n=1 Tax=Monilinia vaccinii-corymbosi TaxID=61207 RepID=A0A8A3PH39_9HELO|nr:hypothetical protein DSL72_005935 [Monilinia vaccinii-corymbosi]
MADLHGNELALHRTLHEKALKVAPKVERGPGEYLAAVLEPDSNWDSKDFHWFKVKGKHTVAKVQKAYLDKCGFLTVLRQGNYALSLESQMQQIDHFKDNFIVFWSTKSISGDEASPTSRLPLQSVDTSTQNRMQPSPQKPTKIEPVSESETVRLKIEADLSTVSPSPWETPAIPRPSPRASEFGTPVSSGSASASAKNSIPVSEPINGFNMFAETHCENHGSSSATSAKVDSSKKAVQNLDSLAPNNAPFSPKSVIDSSSVNGYLTGGNMVMGSEYDGPPAPKDEDGTPEPDLPIAELAKTRLQKIIEDSSPEVLEAEVKKKNDFLTLLKARFNVPEAQSHQETKHWLQQIETLQSQGVDTPTIIGVVGNTGAGKSSVINALLDEERLVPTNCMRACTAVVTEISWNPSEDPSKKYRAEIEFIQEDDWKKDLEVSLADLINGSGRISSESTNPEADAGVAYAKIKAVYPNMTREMIEGSSVEKMLAHDDVQRVLGTTKTVEKSNPEFFYKELQRYVDSKEKSTSEKGKRADKEKRAMEFWPLIKVVRIFVKADALSTGAVVVDLPGVHDSNAARAAVAAGYMKQCTGLWVCAPINRAVDDKAAKSLLGESFKRQLKYDGQFSRITFICSKTDDISVLEASDSLGLEDAIAEDSARIDEIDKKRDDLNAKITEMKESIAVYGSIFSDADETFDVWDDLKRDVEDGKTVYAPKGKEKSPKRKRSPSPKKSRKKAKRSGYEEDDDEDFIDDEEEEAEEDGGVVSENEAEVEEEGLDEGEPLTIEAIEQKLDELKDTKRKARKEKAATELAMKDVRKELRQLDDAKREIDTRMRAKCIDGRNKYSKGAIQQDFAAGIKELDNITAEEEDEEKFNPENEIRDYEAVARSLPVFCVSSRAYQQLNGRLKKDAMIPGFRHVDETEIPQLKAHCKKLTEAGRSASCRRFLNSFLQIVLSLSLWASDDGTSISLSDSQKVADARWLQSELEDLEEKLDQAVADCIIDIKDSLNENIFEKFGEVITLAVDQAPHTVSKWGATVNKFDRDAGGLYWATYKAICRRGGGPYTNKNGAHDWNLQLTEPIMKHLASRWEKSFSRRVPSVLQGFTKRSNEILRTFHRGVEARSLKNGTGIAGLAILAQQLRTYEATFSILATEMLEAINTLQREANREFVPVVAKRLASAYTWCANEVGEGQFKRIKEHMHNHIDQSRHTMFAESCDEVKTRLKNMCQKVEESMNNKIDEVFMLMRRDYLQVLNGAQVSGEVMPKWERHMRSEIARTLEAHERDEAEKVTTTVKDEEAEKDKTMKDADVGEVHGNNDETTEGIAIEDNEADVEADNAAVKCEQSGINKTDNNKESEPPQGTTKVDSFKMDVDGPVTKASSTEIPSVKDFSTDAPSTEAASAKAFSSEALSTEAPAHSSLAN